MENMRNISQDLCGSTYHGEHLGDLRGGAGEHVGHDEVQQRHELLKVVLHGSSCQEKTMLCLKEGGREGGEEEERREGEEGGREERREGEDGGREGGQEGGGGGGGGGRWGGRR